MKSPRLTGIALVLVLVAALAAPAVSAAAHDGSGATQRALAQERYYSSMRSDAAQLPAAASQPAPASVDDPGAWKTVAIIAGALVLVLIAAESVTLVRLRGAHTT